jgi:hypothetical protein
MLRSYVLNNLDFCNNFQFEIYVIHQYNIKYLYKKCCLFLMSQKYYYIIYKMNSENLK